MMKITTGKLGPHFGLGLLKTAVLVSLALGIALTLTLTPGSAAAEGQDELVAPIDLEEGRIAPVLLEPPSLPEPPPERAVDEPPSVPEPPQVRTVVEPPSVLEETRDAPKGVQRQVQGKGVSITQTSSTLISNRNLTGKTGDTAITKEQAQSFTTGSDSSGYTLTSVEMRVHAGGTQMNYSVSIRADSSGNPSTTLGTLTKSGTLPDHLDSREFCGIRRRH